MWLITSGSCKLNLPAYDGYTGIQSHRVKAVSEFKAVKIFERLLKRRGLRPIGRATVEQL